MITVNDIVLIIGVLLICFSCKKTAEPTDIQNPENTQVPDTLIGKKILLTK